MLISSAPFPSIVFPSIDPNFIRACLPGVNPCENQPSRLPPDLISAESHAAWAARQPRREQAAGNDAGMAEQADAGDLKSPDRNGRAGSIPAPGSFLGGFGPHGPLGRPAPLRSAAQVAGLWPAAACGGACSAPRPLSALDFLRKSWADRLRRFYPPTAPPTAIPLSLRSGDPFLLGTSPPRPVGPSSSASLRAVQVAGLWPAAACGGACSAPRPWPALDFLRKSWADRLRVSPPPAGPGVLSRYANGSRMGSRRRR